MTLEERKLREEKRELRKEIQRQRAINGDNIRKQKVFHKFLASKTIDNFYERDGYTVFKMKNGQMFKCKGPLVDGDYIGL